MTWRRARSRQWLPNLLLYHANQKMLKRGVFIGRLTLHLKPDTNPTSRLPSLRLLIPRFHFFSDVNETWTEASRTNGTLRMYQVLKLFWRMLSRLTLLWNNWPGRRLQSVQLLKRDHGDDLWSPSLPSFLTIPRS